MIAAQDAVAAAAQTAGDAVMETADALAQNAPAAQTAVETAKSVSIGFWGAVHGGRLADVGAGGSGRRDDLHLRRALRGHPQGHAYRRQLHEPHTRLYLGGQDQFGRRPVPPHRLARGTHDREGYRAHRTTHGRYTDFDRECGQPSKWPSWKRVCRRWRLSPAVRL